MTAPAWKEFGPGAVLSKHLASLSAGEVVAICDRAGLDRHHGARCRRGRRVIAEAFVNLCAVVGKDPATGQSVPASKPAPVLWWFLACGLSVRRHVDRQNIRDAARRAGVSASTFSAAERGRPVAAESFIKLCAYVGVHPLGFTVTAPAKAPISPKIQTCASARCTGNVSHDTEMVPYPANHLERAG